MKFLKIGLLLIVILALNSCASTYHTINPHKLNYNSKNESLGVVLEYKYNLLTKKYAKKEDKKGVKLVAIKITNISERDLIFGQDIKLIYEGGQEIYIMNSDQVFALLKQHPATYLFYLLLTPLKFYTSKTDSYGIPHETSSFPVGFMLGPGLAGGNMIASGSANKKFKTELSEYNMSGITIKKGEAKSGLIGIKSDNYDALRIKVEY